jgi:hypothetical protein
VFGDSLGDTCLTATEGTWNGASTTLNGGEEGVEDSLASEEGDLAWKLLSHRASLSDGPEVAHVDLLLLSFVFNNNDWLAHGVVALRHDFLDSTLHLRGNHDLVLLEEIVLEGESDHITTSDWVIDLDIGVRSVGPLFVLIETGHIDTSGHEDRSGELGNGLEGSLDTVENCVQNSYFYINNDLLEYRDKSIA